YWGRRGNGDPSTRQNAHETMRAHAYPWGVLLAMQGASDGKVTRALSRKTLSMAKCAYPGTTPSRRCGGAVRSGEQTTPRVQSAPGMGPGCARTWLWDLPELGPRPRQQSAAWVGVAPLKGDRG